LITTESKYTICHTIKVESEYCER